MKMNASEILEFSEFSAETWSDWATLITKDLKGKVQPESLVHQDADGISISAYQTAEMVINTAWQDNFALFQAKNRQFGWHYAEALDISQPQFKTSSQEAVKGGSDALYVFIPEGFTADFNKLLFGLNFKEVAIHILAQENQAALLEYFKQNYPGLAALKGSICFTKHDYAHISEWVSSFPSGKNFQPLVISANRHHLHGATPSQEIALTLSMVQEYIAHLASFGHDVQSLFEKLRIHTAVSTQYLQEISKLKTLQMMLVELQAAWFIKPVLIPIHAETSAKDYVGTDSDTNLLRHTTEAMSALVGGADVLTIFPHKPSDLAFSQRIARNMSHLLREESYFNATIDATGGAWFLNALIDAYAQKSWAYFQSLEGNGGYSAAYESTWHTWQAMNSAFESKKDEAGKNVKIGGNHYPLAVPDTEVAFSASWWA